MRHSILIGSDKEQIISRVLQLNEHTEKQWGNMEVTGMLHHLNESIKLLLSAKPKHPKTLIKQQILKFIFLHILKKFPRNAKTISSLDVVGSRLETNSFEEERTDLLRLLNQFQRATEIKAIHPYFGQLTKNEWGIFTWMHLDHHLRQFDI